MWKVDFSREAARFLETLPAKHAGQIVRKIEALALDPALPGQALVQGTTDLRRLRAGEYRVIYRLEDDTLFIELIDKRNDGAVYKRLFRQ